MMIRILDPGRRYIIAGQFQLTSDAGELRSERLLLPFGHSKKGTMVVIGQWSFQSSCPQSDFKIYNETKSNVYSDTKFSIIYIQIYNNA